MPQNTSKIAVQGHGERNVGHVRMSGWLPQVRQSHVEMSGGTAEGMALWKARDNPHQGV